MTDFGHSEHAAQEPVAAPAKERIHYTQAELLAMCRERFGEDPKQWKFICPHCGDIACAQDFLDLRDRKELGSPPVGQQCIGRWTGALDKPKATNTRGCNWCAYGLFRGPWLITLPNGKEVSSFRLASA